MSRRHEISRRSVLRGLFAGGVVSVGLPPLELFFGTHGDALACGGPIPRRFGIFFWGNGNQPDRWVPTGEGADWQPSEHLAPLYHLKDHLAVVTGTRVRVPNTVPHGSGPAGIFSGMGCLSQGGAETFQGPSVDQIVARQIGKDSRFRSLEIGAAPGSGLSYNGLWSLNPPESSPQRLFERIFGPSFRAPGEERPPDPRLGLRRSILDAVHEDFRRLQADLGAADRDRIEQHLTGIRELEQRVARLEAGPPPLAACARPDDPGPDLPREEGRVPLAAIDAALTDVLIMALTCDQTRVFSNWLTSQANNLLFDGANAGHHQLTHDEPGDQPQVAHIMVQVMGLVGAFIERLAAVPEGDGTLLDHCAVLCTTDCSLGRTHSLDDYPIVIAGSACGALKTGIHYRSATAESASKVVLTMMRAVGADAAAFGEGDARATSTIGALEA